MTCLASDPGPGEPCTLTQHCSSSYCVGAAAGVKGVCTLPANVVSGAHCALDAPYDTVCELGLFCDTTTSTCVPLKGDQAGPCLDGSECKLLMHCVNPVTDAGTVMVGVCRADQPAGSSCATASCLDMYMCDPTTHSCLGPQANGARCNEGRNCQSGVCSVQVCTAACP